MNTIYYVGGISCAGKSTRVFALVSFLCNSNNIQKRPFYFTNRYGERKSIGILFNEKLLVIGRVVNRNGKEAWQGLDSFTNFLQEDLGSSNMYAHIWEWSKKYSVVLDASLLLRSPMSRPYATSVNAPGVNTKTWMFCAESVDEYAKRLSIRSTRTVTKDSGMWKSNSSFIAHIKHHKEELERYGLDSNQYFAKLLGINADIALIGEAVLKDFEPESVKDFMQFVESFKQEFLTMGAIK